MEQIFFIQDHLFWEIRDCGITKFWEDYWQKIPRLENREELRGLKKYTTREGAVVVVDFWKEVTFQHQWREWKTKEN